MLLRQQRRRRRHSSSSSTSTTSTPAIWDRWGSNKKPGDSSPAAVDASTETDASLLGALGEKSKTRERGRRRNKREKTAGEKKKEGAEKKKR